MINVLITAVGAPGAPSIIECLRDDKNLILTGCDMRKKVAGRYLVDKFYQVPGGFSAEYIPKMLEIVESENVRVILPLATFELENLSKNNKLFEKKGCEICISDIETIEKVNNKLFLYNLFKDEKFIPKFYEANNINEFKIYAKELGFPERKFCVKIPVGHGSIGIRIVDNQMNKLDYFLNKKPNSMFVDYEYMISVLKNSAKFPKIFLMRYLEGTEWSYDVLFDKENRVIEKICRKSTLMNFGSADFSLIKENAYIEKIVNKISEKFNLNYLICFDFKEDENGIPKFLEINPRVSATISLSKYYGINFPLNAVYIALNKKIKRKKNLNKNAKVYFYRKALFM